jgi:Bacterial Ig-like domain (group 2)
MTQRYKVTLALLGALLSVFGSSTATAAAPPPKVVFLGDYLTYNWTSGFAANKNWINESRPGMNYPGELSADAAARFQADVVNLHPAIVHILVGAVDAAIADDESAPIVVANFIANIKNMVAQAKAADIKVILATTPAGAPNNFGIIQMNAFLESYGATNGIPVINYDDMLCGCVSSVGGSGIGNIYVPEPAGGKANAPEYVDPTPLMGPSQIPTAAGYARMTAMAQATIASLSGAKLNSGWLGNVEPADADIGVSYNTAGVNRVFTSATLQFTPTGVYSDGVTRALYNTNFAGSSGTWTSSDPYVMYVSQTGLAWAMSAGSATIKYISPTGVRFSEWIMTVVEDE